MAFIDNNLPVAIYFVMNINAISTDQALIRRDVYSSV